MAVRQDEKTGKWYYLFQIAGKRRHGACKGCTTRREAERYEKEQRRLAADLAKIETTSELFEARRRELTGNDGVPLTEAFDRAMAKPKKREPGEKQTKAKRAAFADFVAFIKDTAPDVTDLAAVTKQHAEAYISRLQTSGRHTAEVEYIRAGKTIKRAPRKLAAETDGEPVMAAVGVIPSARTLKLYLTTCESVFRIMAEEAGLSKNPFSGIELPAAKSETREAFSDDELKLIFDSLDDFTRPLFMMAIFTGLREGDICTLRRIEVNLTNRTITRSTRKTGATVSIPIADPIFPMLQGQMNGEPSEYVFPELAKMYLANPTGVSWRIKSFLEGLGITTTRTPKGRNRAVSVKDLHSCRHTFCYLAGLAGVPLSVVQGIVGHMTPEMTKHYSAHATLKDKRDGVSALTGRIARTLEIGTAADEPERLELIEIARTADIELVKKLLAETHR